MALDVRAAGRATARRRILLLTPRWPYPMIGGDRLRIGQLARHLAQRHEISLLSLCQTPQEMQAPIPEDGIFTSVHRVHLPRWRSWLQVAAALPTGSPLQLAYFHSPEFRRKVDDLLPEHDLVCCHLARTAPYAARARVPRWLEMTDAVSLTMGRAAGLVAGPLDLRRWLYQLEARRMTACERALALDFDLVSLVSAVDAGLVGSTASGSLLVAPNGVDLPTRPLPPAGLRPPNIALVGRMDSLANRDALWFFVREVLPGVRRVVPEAKLHVIGHVPAADHALLTRVDGVRVVGTVPHLEDALQHCRIGVCPVRIGAGVQNKVLDYLAHGLACISSPIGLEGLELTQGTEVRRAATPAEWIDQIVRLLNDGDGCSEMGAHGMRWVAHHATWPSALAPLLDRVDELLASRGSDRAPA